MSNQNNNPNQDPNTESMTTQSGMPTLEQLRASEQRYLAKKRGDKPALPLTESAKAYVERMAATEKSEKDISVSALLQEVDRKMPIRKFTPYPYTISEALPVALKIYENRLNSVGRKLIWERNAEVVFGDLVKYFIGDDSGAYDIHKGIFLFGPFGCGKTLLMKAFFDFTSLIESKMDKAERIFTPRAFKVNPCKDIAMEIQRTSTTDSLRQYFGSSRMFDDLGNEEEKKVYGNNINAMSEILMVRYNNYQNGGPVTHCTSNLSPDDCLEVYGERVASRAFEMFNHVYLAGSDKRKL